MRTEEKNKRTVVITNHEYSTKHDTGQYHPEIDGRIQLAFDTLKKAMLPNIDFIKAIKANIEHVLLCHSKEYMQFLQKACEKANADSIHLYKNDTDMKISKKTEEIANLAVGAVIQAIDFVINKKYQNSFCLIRPPGHHAIKDKGMGFCFYNNVAVGARYVLDKYAKSIKKVLIVDWDIHHGNGTQSFFLNDKNVYYFSVHLQNTYPHNPKESSIDSDTVKNNKISSALTGREEVLEAFNQLSKKMDKFRPDFIFISCGFDGHAEEKIVGGGLGLVEDDYIELTKIVKKIGSKYSQNRIVSVLEGGYNLESLARSVEAHVSTLAKK